MQILPICKFSEKYTWPVSSSMHCLRQLFPSMEVFRNEIVAACQPGKKTLNVEVILVSGLTNSGFCQAARISLRKTSNNVVASKPHHVILNRTLTTVVFNAFLTPSSSEGNSAKPN